MGVVPSKPSTSETSGSRIRARVSDPGPRTEGDEVLKGLVSTLPGFGRNVPQQPVAWEGRSRKQKGMQTFSTA